MDDDLAKIISLSNSQGHHHENIEDCCISCNEDEEVSFVPFCLFDALCPFDMFIPRFRSYL